MGNCLHFKSAFKSARYDQRITSMSVAEITPTNFSSFKRSNSLSFNGTASESVNITPFPSQSQSPSLKSQNEIFTIGYDSDYEDSSSIDSNESLINKIEKKNL